jgi:hypothetical protein
LGKKLLLRLRHTFTRYCGSYRVRFSRRAKNFGWFGGQAAPLGSLFGLPGIIEIVLRLLITIGLRTSYAAFIAGICVFRLIRQTKLGLDVLGEDDYSRCLSVQAVHDENPIARFAVTDIVR